MEFKNIVGRDEKGNITPFAKFSLRHRNTNKLVDIYDIDGVALPNPGLFDETGTASFAAPDGEYNFYVDTGDMESMEVLRFLDPTGLLEIAETAISVRNELEAAKGNIQTTLDGMRYSYAGVYGPTLSLVSHSQYFEGTDGSSWMLRKDIPVPFYASGNWATDVTNFQPVSDLSLRLDLANPDMGAAMVGFKQQGSGAVERTVESKLSDVVSVLDFGADATGLTDSSEAFRKAIDKVLSVGNNVIKSIRVPAGTYLIESTVQVSGPIEFVGDGFNTAGTRILAHNSLDSAMFELSGAARFFSMTFLGSNISSNKNESLINIVGANNVSFFNVSFYNCVTGVLVSGGDPAFYITFQNCNFTNALDSFIKLDNSSLGGVDLIMSHCRFLGDMRKRCWDFSLGLGSIIASDIQISVTNTVTGPEEGLVYFGIPAPYYGGGQFTNCVFETRGTSTAGSVILNGSQSSQWKELYFTNCLFTGWNGYSLVIGHASRGAVFTGCTFSSDSTDANILFKEDCIYNGIVFSGCRWESNSEAPIVKGTNVTVKAMFYAPMYLGSSHFIRLDSTVAKSSSIEIIGGSIGLASHPIAITGSINANNNIQVASINGGPLQTKVFYGTLNESGSATVAHGVSSGIFRIVQSDVYYRDALGVMRKAVISAIDGDNVFISSGEANANFRLLVSYSMYDDANWDV